MKGINKKIFSVVVVAILAISSAFLFVACKGDKAGATTPENGSNLSKAEIEAMLNSQKDLKNKIDELQTAKNKLESQKNSAEDSNSELTKKVFDLEAEIESLKNEKENLKGTNKELQEKVAEYVSNKPLYKEIGHIGMNNNGKQIFKFDDTNITPIDFMFATVLDANGNKYPEDLERLIISLIEIDFEDDEINIDNEYSVLTTYQVKIPENYFDVPADETLKDVDYYFNDKNEYHGIKLSTLMSNVKFVRDTKSETKKFVSRSSRMSLFSMLSASNDGEEYATKFTSEEFFKKGYKMVPIQFGDEVMISQEDLDEAITDASGSSVNCRVFIILPPLAA